MELQDDYSKVKVGERVKHFHDQLGTIGRRHRKPAVQFKALGAIKSADALKDKRVAAVERGQKDLSISQAAALAVEKFGVHPLCVIAGLPEQAACIADEFRTLSAKQLPIALAICLAVVSEVRSRVI
jgi:hypothetical protein